MQVADWVILLELSTRKLFDKALIALTLCLSATPGRPRWKELNAIIASSSPLEATSGDDSAIGISSSRNPLVLSSTVVIIRAMTESSAIY
jgi:hypothetical protein